MYLFAKPAEMIGRMKIMCTKVLGTNESPIQTQDLITLHEALKAIAVGVVRLRDSNTCNHTVRNLISLSFAPSN